jgi:hypothetical protein
VLLIAGTPGVGKRRPSIGEVQVHAGVSGLPDFDLKLIVYRSAVWHPPGSPELHVQIRDCLESAKIRANVAGKDVFP